MSAVGSIGVPIEVEKMGFMEGIHLLLRRAQRFDHASDEEINEAGNIVIALDANTVNLRPKGGKKRQESSQSGIIPESKKKKELSDVQITANGCRRQGM
jgi:hypothetical protein